MGGSPTGNSGATIPQLMGYRLIIVGLGDAAPGTKEGRDWQGLQQWLELLICGDSATLQGFIVDGTNAPQITDEVFPQLLNNNLGATLTCSACNQSGCASRRRFAPVHIQAARCFSP